MEPYITQSFETEEDAFKYYKAWAERRGFTAKKGRSDRHYNRRDFVCSREGFQPEKKTEPDKKQRDRETFRCGCKAFMRITLKPDEHERNGGDRWHVVGYGDGHNHAMFSVQDASYVAVNRIMQPFDELRVTKLDKIGLKPTEILRVIELEDNADPGTLPFNDSDIRNFIYKLKAGDAEFDVMDFLHLCVEEKEKDPDFCYKILQDADKRLHSVLWCAAASKRSYEKFGDVVVLDTTYKCNRYNMPVAVFVGVDNHGTSVIFGTALLRDETAATFRWLLENFLNIKKCQDKQRKRRNRVRRAERSR